MTLLSLIGSATIFNNQSKFVSGASMCLFLLLVAVLNVVAVTGNYIPPILSLIPSQFRYSISRYTYPPLVANLLTNPYTLAPIAFCSSILVTLFAVPRCILFGFSILEYIFSPNLQISTPLCRFAAGRSRNCRDFQLGLSSRRGTGRCPSPNRPSKRSPGWADGGIFARHARGRVCSTYSRPTYR